MGKQLLESSKIIRRLSHQEKTMMDLWERMKDIVLVAQPAYSLSADCSCSSLSTFRGLAVNAVGEFDLHFRD